MIKQLLTQPCSYLELTRSGCSTLHLYMIFWHFCPSRLVFHQVERLCFIYYYSSHMLLHLLLKQIPVGECFPYYYSRLMQVSASSTTTAGVFR